MSATGYCRAMIVRGTWHHACRRRVRDGQDYCRQHAPPRPAPGRQDDDIQVTIHGKYGQGPMPVEFRDVLVEMARLVRQAVADGTLPKRRRQPADEGGQG